MKKIHIAGLVLLLIGAYVLIIASKDVSTYSNFEDTVVGKRVKISGTLAKEKEIVYNPDVDAEMTIFYMYDSKNELKKVVLKKAKPQDFERSETIVVTGRLSEDDVFIADEILLKCPSKYKDEEIFIKEAISE